MGGARVAGVVATDAFSYGADYTAVAICDGYEAMDADGGSCNTYDCCLGDIYFIEGEVCVPDLGFGQF